MRNNQIEIQFLDGVYGINTESGEGLDDLEYDLKLNKAIDDCYEVNTIDDLKELFQDGLIKMTNSKGYHGNICTSCNTPIYRDDDFSKRKGKLYCKKC